MAKAEQATRRDIAEVAFMSESFPGKRVAQVQFDEWDCDGQQRIPKRDACVRERTGIQNNEVDAVAP